MTGRKTGLAAYARRALGALNKAKLPYVVVGASALAVRGLPRMTRDIDVVVLADDAIDALEKAGFSSVAPVHRDEEPEAMYVLMDRHENELDLLVSHAEPESTIVNEAKPAAIFGVRAPVASLEHLLLMYLYSNQPKHLGDFARIVTDTKVELREVERYLADVHPEMLPVLRERVKQARHPPPPPPRPKPR